MTIFTKRNALVGYLMLKAQSRARRRWMRRQKQRSAWRLVTLLVLGVVSAGIVIALAGVIHRRQRDAAQLEEAGAFGDDEAEAAIDDLAASSEPLPAT